MSDPEITFRHGACSASIFVNEISRGEDCFKTRTVAFQRRYRDRHGNWQSTTNLTINDIPKAILVLNKSYEYLTSNAHSDREDE